MKIVLTSFLLLLSILRTAAAQQNNVYDPLEAFTPLTLPEPVNAFRSADGSPGPLFWQNRPDYEIHATLDPVAKTIVADETITYTNNSPEVLPSLWIQLDQNIYRKDARAGAVIGALAFRAPAGQSSQGFVLDTVETEPITAQGKSAGSSVKAEYVVSDTRLQLRLQTPLAAHGGKTRIHIHYHYTIPGVWGGRTSWGKAKDGEIYDIAQWYPRMAVFDDLHGWDTQPYLGNEFYCEYGHFDYFVTVPSTFLVAGSGELVNARDVLTPTQMQRLDQARASDKTIMIRTPAEIADPSSRPQGKGGTLTWHFAMENSRDVVFTASPVFVWDAARINLPGGKHSLAESVYPVESVGDAAWGRSTEYVKDTVERFSERWFPYPYPAAINVAGFSEGMEYPGIVFDGINDKGKTLFWITAHEIGHDWFPMIVGSNERRNQWMDEGFNTFIDIEESAKFQGGVYGPKRDSEYSANGEPADTILKVLDDPSAPVILSRSDAMGYRYSHPVSYFKTAFGLTLLREQVLGPERFDEAFRKYIHDWAFHHPSPSDFFRTMESEGGEDLSWFWRGWFMNNYPADFALDHAEYVDKDPAKGALITVLNKGKLPLPFTVEAKLKDGTSVRTDVPVEAWINKSTYVLHLETTQPILTLTLDPDHRIPDSNRSNNVLTVPDSTPEE